MRDQIRKLLVGLYPTKKEMQYLIRKMSEGTYTLQKRNVRPNYYNVCEARYPAEKEVQGPISNLLVGPCT